MAEYVENFQSEVLCVSLLYFSSVAYVFFHGSLQYCQNCRFEIVWEDQIRPNYRPSIARELHAAR